MYNDSKSVKGTEFKIKSELGSDFERSYLMQTDKVKKLSESTKTKICLE